MAIKKTSPAFVFRRAQVALNEAYNRLRQAQAEIALAEENLQKKEQELLSATRSILSGAAQGVPITTLQITSPRMVF